MIRAPLQLLSNSTPFFCPGEQQPVSRSVHLARLAAHFPACRNCAHRFDPDSIVVHHPASGPTGFAAGQKVPTTSEPAATETGDTLPTRDSGSSLSTGLQLFTSNGVRGIYLNELTIRTAAELTAAFAAELWNGVPRPIRTVRASEDDAVDDKPTDAAPATAVEPAEFGSVSQLLSRRPVRLRPLTVAGPTVVIAGDERSMSPEILAGVAAGLRRMACQVIDVGLVTRPAFWFSVQHLQSTGGVYVTGAGCDPAWTGLEFVGEGAVPWSQHGMLDRVIGHFQRGVSRPWRQPGGQRSFSISAAYEASLQQYFHALRPLKVVVMSPSGSVIAGVAKQFAGVACQLVPIRLATRSRQNEQTTRQDLRLCGTAVRENHAHLGIVIQDDAQRCQFVDELGAVVGNDAILAMLADWQLRDHPGRNVLVPYSVSSNFLFNSTVDRPTVDRPIPPAATPHPLATGEHATAETATGAAATGTSGTAQSRRGSRFSVVQRVQMCSGVPLEVTALSDEGFALKMRSSRAVVGSREPVVGERPRVHFESVPGEFWISTPNPTCDAIVVLAGVLHVLSRSDRAFSAVVSD